MSIFKWFFEERAPRYEKRPASELRIGDVFLYIEELDRNEESWMWKEVVERDGFSITYFYMTNSADGPKANYVTHLIENIANRDVIIK